MFSLKVIPLIVAGVFLITSCSTYKEAVCPDFRNNRSYSKKYQSDYKVNKNHYKHHPLRKPQNFNLQTFNKKNESNRQFTLDQNKTVEIGYPFLEPIPNIPAVNIPIEKSEKFALIATTNEFYAPHRSSIIPSSLSNPVKITPPAKEQANYYELSKKEKRQIIKTNKKEFRKTIRSYDKAMLPREKNLPWGLLLLH